MKIDKKAIKELAKLLDETGLNEIEVAEGDQMIRVNKGGGVMPIAAPMPGGTSGGISLSGRPRHIRP